MFAQMLRSLLLLTILAGAALFVAPTSAQATGGCVGLTQQNHWSPECDAEMTANPEPNVLSVAADERALAQFTFMRIINADDETQPVVIYDAPEGQPISTLDPGFNFMTIRQQVGDWIEVNDGEWVEARHLASQQASRFAGVQIVEPLRYPLAWILINTYTAEYPGGPQIIDPARLHYRYEWINIYATVNVDGHNWYLIAPGQWVYHTWIGMAQPVQRPEGVSGRWIAVDLYEQTLVAYEDDRMVFATLVSSGLPGWDTNEGLFTIWARLLNDHMSGAEGASDFYYLENVPYTMYYDGEISLHGTYWHNGFGYRHSHGCVNLSITDARWLFDWTNIDGMQEAPVYVYYSGQY